MNINAYVKKTQLKRINRKWDKLESDRNCKSAFMILTGYDLKEMAQIRSVLREEEKRCGEKEYEE